MTFKFTFIFLFTALTAFAQNNTFPSSGNVGIGTLNPTSSLEILRASSYGDEIGALKIKSSVADQFLYFSYLNSFLSGSIQVIKPGVGVQNLLLNPQGGNIGIGTTTPVEKLSVNGKIRAQEIKIETANWPDYVFDQDYQLLELQNLDAYIKANKHLPDMPSAKEIEINGIALGEMVKLQQKKIEELTLYLIELKKESANQQMQITELKKIK